MKLRNLALALTTAALLPVSAYACDNIDPIRASFERDLDRGFAAQHSPVANADAGCKKQPDQVLASFERDFYHEPAAFETVLVNREGDQLGALFAGLRGAESGPVRISFERDLNRDSAI